MRPSLLIDNYLRVNLSGLSIPCKFDLFKEDKTWKYGDLTAAK